MENEQNLRELWMFFFFFSCFLLL